MEEPTGKTATTETVVADDDLSAAWNAVESDEVVVVEPKKVETKKDEKPLETADTKVADGTKTEQPTELSPEEKERIAQQERSKLGRQNKGLKDRLAQLESTLNDRSQKQASTDSDLPEVISTPQDVDRVIEDRKQKAQQAQERYERDYIKMLDSIEKSYGGDKAKIEFHEEVVDHMIKNFNKKWSDSAFGDARVNYAEAKASLMETKSMPQAKLPKRNTSDDSPVQPAASSTRTATKVVTLPALDDAAKDYVAYLRKSGYTDEQIAKELE